MFCRSIIGQWLILWKHSKSSQMPLLIHLYPVSFEVGERKFCWMIHLVHICFLHPLTLFTKILTSCWCDFPSMRALLGNIGLRLGKYALRPLMSRIEHKYCLGRGETKLTVSRGTSHLKVFCCTSQLQSRVAHKFTAVSRSTWESKVQVVVSLGS